MAVRLYAVVRLDPRARGPLPTGLGGEKIRLVKWAGLHFAIAVSSRHIDPAPASLLEFDEIIRALTAMSEAILPARFGTVAAAAQALKAEAAARAAEWTEALNRVAGRVQMSVRLAGAPARRTSTGGSGTTHLVALAAASTPPALATLRKKLRTLVRAERVERGPAGMTVYHLVEKDDVVSYCARAAGFRVSGPFPPYAFASGIDSAISARHETQDHQPARPRSARSRAGRRSARNTRG